MLIKSIQVKEWAVNFSEEFEKWWEEITENQQISISASVKLLRHLGPNLGFPHSSGIKNSAYSHMRELRVQHRYIVNT